MALAKCDLILFDMSFLLFVFQEVSLLMRVRLVMASSTEWDVSPYELRSEGDLQRRRHGQRRAGLRGEDGARLRGARQAAGLALRRLPLRVACEPPATPS